MRTCASSVCVVLLIAGCYVLLPSGRSHDFEDLSGEEAKLRLKGSWPATVDPSDVRAMSCRWRASRDSSSTWYRIELESEAAERWQEQVHAEAEHYSMSSLNRSHFAAAEGIHRSIAGPPSLRNQTGATPAWWAPPEVEFRASEAMRWYESSGSGVAQATYSGFDASTGILWIYQYSCQHDRMWARGKVPEGELFETEAE